MGYTSGSWLDTMGGSVTSCVRVVCVGPTEVTLGSWGVEGEARTGVSRWATVSRSWGGKRERGEWRKGGREGWRDGGREGKGGRVKRGRIVYLKHNCNATEQAIKEHDIPNISMHTLTSRQCLIQKYPPQCSQFCEHTMYSSRSNSFFWTLAL